MNVRRIPIVMNTNNHNIIDFSKIQNTHIPVDVPFIGSIIIINDALKSTHSTFFLGPYLVGFR